MSSKMKSLAAQGFSGEHRALLKMWREKLEPLLPPGAAIPQLFRQNSAGIPAFGAGGARGGGAPGFGSLHGPRVPSRFLPPLPPPPMQHRASLFAWYTYSNTNLYFCFFSVYSFSLLLEPNFF